MGTVSPFPACPARKPGPEVRGHQGSVVGVGMGTGSLELHQALLKGMHPFFPLSKRGWQNSQKESSPGRKPDLPRLDPGHHMEGAVTMG